MRTPWLWINDDDRTTSRHRQQLEDCARARYWPVCHAGIAGRDCKWLRFRMFFRNSPSSLYASRSRHGILFLAYKTALKDDSISAHPVLNAPTASSNPLPHLSLGLAYICSPHTTPGRICLSPLFCSTWTLTTMSCTISPPPTPRNSSA